MLADRPADAGDPLIARHPEPDPARAGMRERSTLAAGPVPGPAADHLHRLRPRRSWTAWPP
ncbi:hypothetical protein [Nonomuraea ferruginea]|uniref:Uncharacterized protein n=1 Tax=Nonomuraea ferruginea TaxID=46174 RepID=A0ABT4SWZ1_9ACTN|nr:hypothetical protein [Nonomuraea ferruginea]MDA0641722.1 hypothetical protein [Nonomuraea ferruginea]